MTLLLNVYTLNFIAITSHHRKAAEAFAERGLLFADAEIVFAGATYTFQDLRHDYGEVRNITIGFLAARMVVVGWTPRGADRHVFSMRKANDREQKKYLPRLAREDQP